MKNCPKCNTIHEKQGTFCSRKCANSRIRTLEIKQKVSNTLKGRKVGAALLQKPDPEKWETRICLNCKCTYTCYKISTKKFCSQTCGRQTSGGYRERSGRGKSGTYKGIFCNSTYELAWVIYRLDHNLPVKRFPGYLTDGKIKYYPDFIDDDTIIEIKGYHTSKVDEKAALAIEKGYKIKILYKQHLTECFDWVKLKYDVKKIENLYDKN